MDDVHEEVRTFRAERSAYKRSTRREKRGQPNLDDVPLGEVEQDIGFDETEPNKRDLEGRVVMNPFSLVLMHIVVHLMRMMLRRGSTVRRARSKVLLEIMGDQEKEFERILNYRDEVLKTNPGSTYVVKVSTTEFAEDGRPCFLGFYICFDALKRSFLSGCRRCIGLDGCFLKGYSKGQLLVAVAKDGNNQMLPIAWALWNLNLGDGTGYTVISDMQKGLLATIKELLPEVEQRQCARHILANWSKDWGGLERRLIFWKCARSTFEADLRRNLDKLELLGAESFNAWILTARHKTIITMLEEIRMKVMTRISVMRSFANTWVTRISPMALRTLEENMGKSMNCNIVFNGEHGFEILDGPYRHTVDIVNEKCSCRS
ncbi:uncharacterized protein LOC132048680 [Lycium ferocissimum]|uniref:uncharacterized protein LOC132048680 n=1 Tax=Lycium ferocissimum TaxID=112874 RepID=UPI0028160666|nr:uncharacterized protein LOC132048680 [Lycium ferocissimum]